MDSELAYALADLAVTLFASGLVLYFTACVLRTNRRG